MSIASVFVASSWVLPVLPNHKKEKNTLCPECYIVSRIVVWWDCTSMSTEPGLCSLSIISFSVVAAPSCPDTLAWITHWAIVFFISSPLQMLTFLIFLLLLPSIFHSVDAFATEVTVFVISRSAVLSTSSLFGRCARSGNNLNIVHLGKFFSSWVIPQILIFFFLSAPYWNLYDFPFPSTIISEDNISPDIFEVREILWTMYWSHPLLQKISTPGFKYDPVFSISLFLLFFFTGFLWGK